jgi:DNA-binding IclR family transcriptional regulator
MSPAKAHRYLVSFVEAGLVVQLERTGEYDLGPLATRLGLAAIQRFDVVRTAGERLAELRDAVDATTLLALWTDVGPTVARIVLSAHPVTLAVRIGTAFLILSTATGRVYRERRGGARRRSTLRFASAIASAYVCERRGRVRRGSAPRSGSR